MTSDSAPDPSRPAQGLWWRGLVAGAAAGALTGLADTLRALIAGRELLQPRDAPEVVAFYAACFAVCGLLASIAARAFEMPRRALHLFVIFGAAFFFAAAWVNVSLLPGFTSGLALTVDVVLLVVTALWFRNRYRDTALDGMRTGRWLLAGIVAAVLAAAATLLPPRDEGVAPIAVAAPGAPRPNVLVVLCDTLRADHLGCMGYEKPTSPEIDAFAKDATLFADCRTVTSWTKPAVASMFTSLYPTMHGCVEQRQVLVPEHETLPEIFRTAGWRTAAFVDNPFVSPEFGFGQGFAAKDYRYVRPSVVANGTLLGKALFMTRMLSLVGKPFGVGEHVERGTQALRQEFFTFVNEPTDAPWFAYVHAMDPHLPYEPHLSDAAEFGIGKPWLVPPVYNDILPFTKTPPLPESDQKKLVAQYDAEIRGFSREFGAIVSGLSQRGQLENTIVVLVSDHGEEFHEHGGWTHGHSLHREVTQVPLIVRVPASLGPAAAASRGAKVGGVATLLDVMPTLLELCRVAYPRGTERSSGRSLAEFLLSEPGRVRSIDERVLLGEVTMKPVGIRSIRQGRWQLIEAHKPPLQSSSELFDDVSDPHHRRERRGDASPEAAALKFRLEADFGALERAATFSPELDLDPETAARLRAIGYLGEKK